MADLSRREWLAATGAVLVTGALCGTAEETEEAMVTIPAGPFGMGTSPEQAEKLATLYRHHVSWLSGEIPERRVELSAFAIDKYPVTNRRFAAFCRASGYAARPHWGGDEPPEALLDHPVTMVNRDDAQAYAKWAGKRLPTEAEWEKAARGPDGRLFPWGDEFDPEACRWDPGGDPAALGTAPVAAHPKGASPYGVMDLCGNAAEWCGDGPGPGSAFVKGGCWLTATPLNLRAAARNYSGFTNNASAFYGFRCVCEAAS